MDVGEDTLMTGLHWLSLFLSINASSLIIHISTITGANLTKFSHIYLHKQVLKCGYCTAIAQLCTVAAQSNVFQGASKAIAMSVPGLLEMFVWLLAGHHMNRHLEETHLASPSGCHVAAAG